MKKTVTAASKYVISESSMVVVDHMQFQAPFFNRLIGKMRTRGTLNNTKATFMDFRESTFPDIMKEQYNLVCKLIDEHNHK